MRPLRIGVLALQGAVEPHVRMLQACGVEAVMLRDAESLKGVDGLILPGGESTTLRRLLRLSGLDWAIAERLQGGMPAFGTCAGLILLAGEIENQDPSPLGLVDITVRRNAYGRQVDSFETRLHLLDFPDFPAVFIRAPQIARVGSTVEVLARFEDRAVAARQGHLWFAAFHPELTGDERFHRAFVEYVRDRADKASSTPAQGGPMP